MVRATDELNFLLAHERFNLDPAIPRVFFQQIHDWTESLHTEPQPVSWKLLEEDVFRQQPDAGVMMRHISYLVTRDRYRRVQEQAVLYDREMDRRGKKRKNGTLLEQMREVALMYELSHNHLFKQDVFGPLVLRGMGIDEAVRIMWKWGCFEIINGPLREAAARNGQPDAVEKAMKKIARL
jgi:hypothetical protein